MTDSEHARAAETALKKTTVTYPEWLKRKKAGKYPDPALTNWGVAFGHLAAIGAVVSPPGGFVIAAPGSTGKQVHTSTGNKDVAVNLDKASQNGTVVQDWIVDDCGEQSILLQPGVSGCKVLRCLVTRPGAHPTNLGNSGPLHALYLKAAHNEVEDFDVDYRQGGFSGSSAFTVRHGDNKLSRTRTRGPVSLACTYFEHATAHEGLVTFDGGWWEATDVGFWGDDTNLDAGSPPKIKQDFLFRNIEIFAPEAIAFQTGSLLPSCHVTVENVMLNGKKLTSVRGVPANQLTIS